MLSLINKFSQVGVCVGNMEEGSFRVDVNVSVHEVGEPLGARCEVKNLNSFKSISRAIDFESERQRGLLSRGLPVLPETRLFNAATGQTVKMRNKDSMWDYRFMPDPDIPALHVCTLSNRICVPCILQLTLFRYRMDSLSLCA